MLLITWGGGHGKKIEKGQESGGKKENKQDFVYSLINHEYQLSKGGKIMELSYSDENGEKVKKQIQFLAERGKYKGNFQYLTRKNYKAGDIKYI